jgi:hypothetical protein
MDIVVTNIIYVTVWASVSTITCTLSQFPADSNLAKSPTTGTSTLLLSPSDISSTSGPILQATGTSLKFYDILLGGKSLEYNKKHTFVNNSSLYDLNDYHNFFLQLPCIKPTSPRRRYGANERC